MASPIKTFLGSWRESTIFPESWRDFSIPEVDPDADPDSEWTLPAEADFYAPRSPSMRRKRVDSWVLPSSWHVVSQEEMGDIQEQMARDSERLPLVRGQVGDNEEAGSDCYVFTGFMLSVVAHLFLTISSGSIQELSHEYPEMELNVFRFAGSILLAPPMLIWRRQLPRLFTKLEIIGTVLVTVLTVGFNSCLFASVKYAPLGAVGCLDKTSIMLVAMVMARIVMREKITGPKIIAAVVGTGGVLMVTQPWSEKHSDSESKLWLGYVLATSAGVIAALKIIAQKRLIPTTDVVTIQFWTSLGGLAISGLFMALPDQRPTLPSGLSDVIRDDWLYLLAHAFTTGIATLLIYKSQQMISAILFSLSTSFNVVFMLIGQYTVLRDFKPGPHYNAEEYSGAVLVVLSAIFVPVYAIIKKKCFPSNQQEQLLQWEPESSGSSSWQQQHQQQQHQQHQQQQQQHQQQQQKQPQAYGTVHPTLPVNIIKSA